MPRQDSRGSSKWRESAFKSISQTAQSSQQPGFPSGRCIPGTGAGEHSGSVCAHAKGRKTDVGENTVYTVEAEEGKKEGWALAKCFYFHSPFPFPFPSSNPFPQLHHCGARRRQAGADLVGKIGCRGLRRLSSRAELHIWGFSGLCNYLPMHLTTNKHSSSLRCFVIYMGPSETSPPADRR